jgi:hypothetical protein
MASIVKFTKGIFNRARKSLIGELLLSDKVIIDRGHTTLRINVRKKDGSGECLIGLALLASGSSAYHIIEGHEIDDFVRIVNTAKAFIDSRREISQYP